MHEATRSCQNATLQGIYCPFDLLLSFLFVIFKFKYSKLDILAQLCFCQILFKLVYSWESYHKNKTNELFIETQCSIRHEVNLAS